MGSSRSPTECGVGSIVWVRRRNGSWWPGKILGSDELPSSHLTSPRSGTPVKLLGREDASVDWYNLEKSKRVKAFRCGEFDDCIEKAESSQGMPMKKREKYARREDAILHALELERSLMKEQGKLSDNVSNEPYETMEKELFTASERLLCDNGKLRSSRSLKSRGGSHMSGEGDQSENSQDVGLQQKFSSMPSNSPSTMDNDVQNLQSDVNLGSTSHENGEEKVGDISRAKRSRCVYFPGESNGAQDTKKSPSSPMEMPACHLENNCPPPVSLAEVNPSEHMEDSGSDSSDSGSDSTESEPDRDGGMSSYLDVSTSQGAKPNALRRLRSISSEELFESAVSGENSNPYPNELISPNEAVSKWQSKGKRNARNLKKRSLEAFSSFIFFRNEDPIDNLDETDFSAKESWSQMGDLENGESSFISRSASKHRYGFGHDWEDQMPLKGHWEEKREQLYPTYIDRTHIGGKRKPMLFDVDVKVQGAGYQKEPVPIISLMSKVNGKAIIGHPIQIETLENGSTDNFLSNCGDFFHESIGHDESTAPKPSWKTARRTTGSRASRPHLPSLLDDEEYTEELSLSDQEWNASTKKSSIGGSNKKGNLMRNSRKVPKKASLASNQKTRTLTSIASHQKVSNCQIDGLTKPECTGPATVACIPSKLVFSRLFQKIK